MLHDRPSLVGLRQHVDVPHRLLPPAVGAGHLQPAHPRGVPQVLQQGLHVEVGVGEEEALGVAAVLLDALEDLLLGLRPEAVQLLHPSRLGRRLQLVHRRDAKLVPQLLRALGADARQAGDLGQRARYLLGHLLQLAELAGLHQLGDVVRHVVADGGELGEVGAVGHELAHGDGMLPNGAGGVAVGPHPEPVGAPDLQQVGQLLQDVGDLVVLHPPVTHRRPPRRGVAGERPILHPPPTSTPRSRSSSTNAPSSSVSTPRSRASSALEPGSSPTTT